jgi:hypothetical protein
MRFMYATGIRRRFPRTKTRILREFFRNIITRKKFHGKPRSILGEFLSEAAARIGAEDHRQSRELDEIHGTDITSG